MLKTDILVKAGDYYLMLLKLEGFLVGMDIEKAFDSLDHSFLIFTPE